MNHLRLIESMARALVNQKAAPFFADALVAVLRAHRKLREEFLAAIDVPVPADAKEKPTTKSSALQRIEAHAEAIQKREPGITKEQSIAKALTERPELYTAYFRATPEAPTAVAKTEQETVKQFCDRYLMEKASLIEKTRGLPRAAAIAAAVNENYALYKMTFDPQQRHLPMSEALAASRANQDADALAKGERALVIAKNMLGELEAACRDEGIAVPILKRTGLAPSRAMTFNEVRALKRQAA